MTIDWSSVMPAQFNIQPRPTLFTSCDIIFSSFPPHQEDQCIVVIILFIYNLCLLLILKYFDWIIMPFLKIPWLLRIWITTSQLRLTYCLMITIYNRPWSRSYQFESNAIYSSMRVQVQQILKNLLFIIHFEMERCNC